MRGASLEIAMIPNLTTNRRGRLLLVVQEAVYVGTRRWACQRVEPAVHGQGLTEQHYTQEFGPEPRVSVFIPLT